MKNKKKSNVLTIIKKEFARFFGDKRMAILTIFLPGCMIYFMYSLMGNALMKNFQVEDDYKPIGYAIDCPSEIETMMSEADIEVRTIRNEQKEEILNQLQDQKTEIGFLIEFPVQFMQDVLTYDSSSGNPAPNVKIYFNSVSTKSATAGSMMREVLNDFERGLSNRFDVNSGEEKYDMASEEDSTGKFFSTMFPMLMMIFMYSGCMAIAPESIAGEKERGTIATLLVTPLKRWELAVGKIVSLSAIALLSGISSFIGTYLSLPNMMVGTEGSSQNLYQLKDYVLLLGIILSTIVVMISMICIISAFAKSVKEAGTMVMPLMMIVMVIGISAMFGSGAKQEVYFYFIPLYNSVQSMIGIFSRSYQPINAIFSIIANIITMGVCVTGLSFLFNSEKIVYTK